MWERLPSNFTVWFPSQWMKAPCLLRFVPHKPPWSDQQHPSFGAERAAALGGPAAYRHLAWWVTVGLTAVPGAGLKADSACHRLQSLPRSISGLSLPMKATAMTSVWPALAVSMATQGIGQALGGG